MSRPDSRKISRLTVRVAAVAGLFSSLLYGGACAAVDFTSVENAAGSWELALRDTERRCGMQLRAEKTTYPGYSLAMPAGCRRALPILAEARAWAFKAGDSLQLDDGDGTPLLSFPLGPEDALVARGPEGETYELIPTGRQKFAQASPASGSSRPVAAPGIRPAAPAPGPASVPPGSSTPAPQQPQRQSAQAPLATPVASGAPTTAVRPFTGRASDIAGRYIILRDGGKDVGCMLTLNDQARGPGGTFKAQLAPACRDNGIVVFDPLGWQLDRGRLSLTARKGHKAMFEHHEDGAWWKDPKEGGKPLGVRKMER